MKKLIVLVLALTCVLSMFAACGGNSGDNGGGGNNGDNPPISDDLANFADKVNESDPSQIDADIVVQNDDVEIGATIKYKMGEKPVVTIEYLGKLEIGATPDEEYTIEKANLKNWKDGTPITLSEMSFNPEYFKKGEYEVSEDEFSATISNTTGFFGTNLGVREADVVIELDDGAVAAITITYESNGYEVTIEMEYK